MGSCFHGNDGCLHGNDGLGVVARESPSPQPSPVKGEGVPALPSLEGRGRARRIGSSGVLGFLVFLGEGAHVVAVDPGALVAVGVHRL